MKMKVLILGDGFIAKNLDLFLDENEYQVFKVSRKTKVGSGLFDFFDESKLRSVIQDYQPNILINTIWNTELSSYTQSSLNFEYVKYTILLAEICIQSRVSHFISLGSSAEYGETPGACDAERTECKPESIYAQSKLDTFRKISGLYQNTTLRFNWVRIFQPYGLYQESSRFIPQVIECFSSGKELELKDANSRLDWIFSIDISRAVEFIINNETPEILDLGNSVPIFSSDVVDVIARRMGIKAPSIRVSHLASESKNRFVSETSFLVQNWTPQFQLEKGIEWLVSNVRKD